MVHVTININDTPNNYIKKIKYILQIRFIVVYDAYDKEIPFLCGRPTWQALNLLKSLVAMQSTQPEIIVVYPGIEIKVEDISSLTNPFNMNFNPKQFNF